MGVYWVLSGFIGLEEVVECDGDLCEGEFDYFGFGDVDCDVGEQVCGCLLYGDEIEYQCQVVYEE